MQGRNGKKTKTPKTTVYVHQKVAAMLFVGEKEGERGKGKNLLVRRADLIKDRLTLWAGNEEELGRLLPVMEKTLVSPDERVKMRTVTVRWDDLQWEYEAFHKKASENVHPKGYRGEGIGNPSNSFPPRRTLISAIFMHSPSALGRNGVESLPRQEPSGVKRIMARSAEYVDLGRLKEIGNPEGTHMKVLSAERDDLLMEVMEEEERAKAQYQAILKRLRARETSINGEYAVKVDALKKKAKALQVLLEEIQEEDILRVCKGDRLVTAHDLAKFIPGWMMEKGKEDDEVMAFLPSLAKEPFVTVSQHPHGFLATSVHEERQREAFVEFMEKRKKRKK
jgi:hypothetical protein